jgi:cysteine desulfurase / selenocysteine lyase
MNQLPFSNEELAQIRSNFTHTEKGHIYLNHAAIGPLSKKVKSAIDDFILERHSGPIENLEHCMEISETTRSLISRYINSPDPGQISYMGNTSEAISAITEGLDWNQGDEVILNSMEFPTNVQPYRALAWRGVKTVILQANNSSITSDQIEQAITKNTRVVSISAVQFLSGFRADLEAIGEICRQNNLLFVVDAIQCLGAMPIDVQKSNIDALATGGHKWLLSPMGLGFLYCSKKLATRLKPFRTGWLSVQEPWDLFNYEQEWQPLSQYLEVGTPNMIGITGMGDSIQSLFDVGTDKIQLQINNLTRHVISQLDNHPKAVLVSSDQDRSRAGIVTFRLEQNEKADKIVENLKTKKITISAREGLFRISPHYYNTLEEIDNALGEIF